MRILLDNNVPIGLKRHLSGFQKVLHCRDLNWRELNNGQLVRSAHGKFDVMITIDKNMATQTSIGGLDLCVLVLEARNNSLSEVLRFVPSIIDALKNVEAGSYCWLRL